MRYYVASRFGNYRQVRAVCDRLRKLGHEITFDWTRTDEFDEEGTLIGNPADLSHTRKLAYAHADIEGVRTCERMVMLCVPDMGGAYIEAGIAITRGITIYTVGTRRETVFWSLPNFIHFDYLEDLITFLRFE